MAKPVLSYRAMASALVSRLLDGDTLSVGRSEYVGASEVGGCPRLVTYRKALGIPWRPDAEAAGYMLPGRLAENEVIQFLRGIGLDRSLSATGRSQVTLEDPDFPLKAHPDGFLAEEAFELDESTTYYRVDGSAWNLADLRPIIEGPGIVEVKSGSSGVFKSAVRGGISPTYLDQTMGEMGLSGRRWTLVIFVSRDNLSRFAFFFIPFDPLHFAGLQRRAAAMMGSAALARGALFSSGLDSSLPENEDAVVEAVGPHLLAPDSDRGYCSSCPIRWSCPAISKGKLGDFFPESVAPTVEALGILYKEASAREVEAKEEKDGYRDQIVELAKKHGASRLKMPPPFTSLSVGEQAGRKGCDFDLLHSYFPDAYARCVSEGDPFWVVRVNESKKKG